MKMMQQAHSDATALKVLEAVNALAGHHFDTKWQKYFTILPQAAMRRAMMVKVFAYAMSGFPVARRTQLTTEDEPVILLQQLESDGMLKLEPAGVFGCCCALLLLGCLSTLPILHMQPTRLQRCAV